MKRIPVLKMCAVLVGISAGLGCEDPDARAVDALVERIKTPDTDQTIPLGGSADGGGRTARERAVYAIAKLGPKAAPAVPELIKLYRTDGPPVISCAGSGDALRFCEGFGPMSYKRSVLDALAAIGPPADGALPFLAEEIMDHNRGYRRYAMTAYAAIAHPEADWASLERLVEFSMDPESYDARKVILFALDMALQMQVSSPGTQRFLCFAIAHRYLPIRRKAAEIIATLGVQALDAEAGDRPSIRMCILKKIRAKRFRSEPHDRTLLSGGSSLSDEELREVEAHFDHIMNRLTATNSTFGGDYRYLETLGPVMVRNADRIEAPNLDYMKKYIGRRWVGSPDDSLQSVLMLAAKLGPAAGVLVPELSERIRRDDYRYEPLGRLAVEALEAIGTEEARTALQVCRSIPKGYRGHCHY